MTSWYAIRSKPNAEAVARDHLKRQEYDVFLPLLACPRLDRRGQPDWFFRPYFPSYAFVAVEEWQPFTPIRSTPGVAALVGNSVGPIPIPWPVIAELKARVDEHDVMPALLPPVPPFKRFKPGDPIVVRSGPLAGFRAIVETVDLPVLRAWIEIMGGRRSVTLRESEADRA